MTPCPHSGGRLRQVSTHDRHHAAQTSRHVRHRLTLDRPFSTYLALGATRAPLHVGPEWQKSTADGSTSPTSVAAQRPCSL